MRVLLAFDKFKDALSADEACAAAAAALRRIRPKWTLDFCPLTDGGEGFTSILTSAAGGQLRRATVTGPRGDPVDAVFGLAALREIPPPARALLQLPAVLPDDARIALVEMAAASGLALLPPSRRDPWQTSSIGTGELMRAAVDAGAAAIVLGVGGSATNDLGLGALAALGFEFRSAQNDRVMPPIPARWSDISRVISALDPAFPPIRIACDVTNPLLGPHGCAAVFGPQKGLRPADLPALEQASGRIGLMLCAHCDQPDSRMRAPGAGAAGGIAFGLMTGKRAQLLPGFALVSAWLDLDARIAAADLVLTGEGRFDASSRDGKGPGAVLARARTLERPAQVFAGAIAETAASDSFHAITPPNLRLEDALPATARLLREAVETHFASARL